MDQLKQFQNYFLKNKWVLNNNIGTKVMYNIFIHKKYIQKKAIGIL